MKNSVIAILIAVTILCLCACSPASGTAPPTEQAKSAAEPTSAEPTAAAEPTAVKLPVYDDEEEIFTVTGKLADDYAVVREYFERYVNIDKYEYIEEEGGDEAGRVTVYASGRYPSSEGLDLKTTIHVGGEKIKLKTTDAAELDALGFSVTAATDDEYIAYAEQLDYADEHHKLFNDKLVFASADDLVCSMTVNEFNKVSGVFLSADSEDCLSFEYYNITASSDLGEIIGMLGDPTFARIIVTDDPEAEPEITLYYAGTDSLSLLIKLKYDAGTDTSGMHFLNIHVITLR